MIFVCEHHDQLLTHWRDRDQRGIRLLHVDFHDDLRGLLLDRRRQVGYPIGALARGEAAVDPGNFLAHAALEGRLDAVWWLHGDPGGRAWDMGIVRYVGDLGAIPHRWRQWRRPRPAIGLEFAESLLGEWTRGVPADACLSVDWDCFASVLLDEHGIDARVNALFDVLGDTRPTDAWAVYSPEYSRPTLERFLRFVDELGSRFGQEVEWLSPGLREGELSPADVDGRLPTDLGSRAILALRRLGIF